jgi:hypothetical protein
MVTKVVAGGFLFALAAFVGRSEADAPYASAHPVVVRVSAPLPFGDGRGGASFSATLGETRWRVAATCYGGTNPEKRARFALVLAAEPAPAD